MELTLLESGPEALRAGYTCPCGCTPSVEFARGAELAEEGCCCGNHFAVGPRAAASLTPTPGFEPELKTFDAPWGEHLEAAWLVGPSVHGPESGADHHADHHADHAHVAIDPVCGMTVEPEAARARGLFVARGGTDYFFCGKGCKLEFGDDPERFLDPAYVPSM
ncbi:MAG: YHS domain-containing protein [Chloroflexota bacterium]